MANMASKTIPGKRSSPPRTTRRALERYSRFIVTFKCIFAFVCMPVSNTRKMNDRLLMSFRNGMLNTLRVKEWRHNIIRMCKDAATEEDTSLVCKRPRDFTSAMHEKESSHNLDLKPEYWIQICPFIFLDLGTGVGNKLAKFIDSGLEGCRRNDTDTLGFDPMHFDVGTGTFKEVVSNSMVSDDDFTHWVKGKIASFYPGLGPEDYCVYGVEPNPLVNADLFKLERHVVSSHSSKITCITYMNYE